MSVLSQLASSLGRRDETPNQELAAKIVATKDKSAVQELITLLDQKNRDVQNDCIKTLYEIGEKEPKLIAGYVIDFVKLLDSKNNRAVWGAMTALASIAAEVPDETFQALSKIMDRADNSGSVIARDYAMHILASLATKKAYYENCMVLIQEQLMKAPLNQLPMYCEITAPVVAAKDKEAYRNILEDRLETIDLEAKRKRIEKVLKKL